MRYTPDTLRMPTTPRHSAGYECVLPLDARSELTRPHKAAAPPPPPPVVQVKQKSPPPSPRYIRGVINIVVVALFLVAALIGALSRHNSASTPTPISTPTPAPALDKVGESQPSVQTPAVRRAEVVPVTVRRATLLRLPTQELGVYKWYPLPDAWGGGRVWARFMGTKGRFSEIPPNPVPGDLWNVTETGASWIYCVPIGYNHAAWIDP
jgi:hypothetical protein